MSAGSPRSVVFVVDGLGLSGKTRTLAYLATHLDPIRYRPIVCSLSEEASVLQDQLTAADIPVHYIPSRDGLDLRAIRQIGRLIRANRTAVVHCYNPRPILYGGIAARVLGIRARVGTLSAFACQVPDRTYDFLPQPLTTTSRRNIWRNRVGIGLMRYVTTVSPSLGTRFCDYNGISLDKLRVVPYGADLSAVEGVTEAAAAQLRQELGWASSDIVVGSVGRLVEQKDYPTQLKAFKLATEKVPQLRMALAGDGPLAAPLQDMVRDLGLSDRVQFLGHWTRVPALLRAMDIFVLASKFEPFGVAILEAKAAGAAIVATRVNEIPEIVSDGDSGLLSESGDAVAMAESFTRLALDPSLRARIGASARQDARERHSLASVVDAYQQLYDACSN